MKAGNITRLLWVVAVTTLLSACGGGGSKASVNQPTASISYLQGVGLVVGAATPPLRPTISGSVTGHFSISPPLSPGLAIDPNLGNIYGVPTAPAPTTTYRVDAMSAEGPISTTVTFTVRDVVPRISFSPDSFNLTQDVALAANITPANTGGAVVSWSIDRALPAGLAFDTASGTISGTPTAASPQSNYLVTATNSGGTDSATLTLTVLAASGSGRVTIHATARTAGTDSVGSAGNTAVVQSGSWLMVFVRGAPLSNIAIPAGARWWLVAADGSYIVAATDTRLSVWSPAGTLLFTRAANYADAGVFAAAGELRVGAGPAGEHVIEFIAVPTGIARLGTPFPESFRSWSEDGERFIAGTNQGTRIYSRDATQSRAEG